MRLIENKLDNLARKVDQTFRSMQDVIVQQMWQEAATVYSHAVSRLQYFIHVLNDNLHAEPNGEILPADLAMTWATSVLSSDADGMGPVLFQFHQMMKGSGGLFSRHPLVEVYVGTLDNTEHTQFKNNWMSLRISRHRFKPPATHHGQPL